MIREELHIFRCNFSIYLTKFNIKAVQTFIKGTYVTISITSPSLDYFLDTCTLCIRIYCKFILRRIAYGCNENPEKICLFICCSSALISLSNVTFQSYFLVVNPNDNSIFPPEHSVLKFQCLKIALKFSNIKI